MSKYNITDQDGQILVSTAREIVVEFVTTGKRITLGKDIESKLSFDAGLFVTLNSKNDLRGCIGFPLPRKISQALPEAAIAAATEDPRFSPVDKSELNKITFEVTILTPPEEIMINDKSKLPEKIKVGKDGLIIKQGHNSGLLLPQVPVEYGWNEQEFLSHTCQKAGLPSDCWMQKQTKVYSFEGIIFKEENPNGKIIREKL
ncbi:MAG: TIGR00296 family protein [Nitrososphaeria archaeon]|nr:TIGR00296 family protein [Nitrososphaeria archaeon]